MNLDNPSEQDSPDPHEEIRQENEIMKIKLQAEFGAVFDENDRSLSPELEQQFLENVYQFEKAWEKQEIVTVSKMLNNPIFTPFENLQSAEQESEWLLVTKKYSDAGIEVEFEYDYPLEVKYRFLAEELPLHETVLVNMPGMTLGFVYEEFHPNIAGDLEKLANKFLKAWFERDLVTCVSCLSKRLVMETGMVISSEDAGSRLQNMFECFEMFDNCSYQVLELSYDRQVNANDIPEYILGYSEGEIEWTAVVDAKEQIEIQGSFKLYFEGRADEWSIMYFVLPGWSWSDE